LQAPNLPSQRVSRLPGIRRSGHIPARQGAGWQAPIARGPKPGLDGFVGRAENRRGPLSGLSGDTALRRWPTAVDLGNLLTCSEAITRSALERKESRGAQFRDDYPEKDERLAKVNTVIRKAEDGSMEVRLEPLPEMPDYLKQVIEENR